MVSPSVFISYSHDSKDHKAWVLRLATHLRESGIDASLDQWDLSPGQDVAAFMQAGVSNADRVLLICTEGYVQKADEGVGGVGYERLIVTAEVVAAIETKKFIPVVRNNSLPTKIPKHLGGRLYLDFSDDSKYEESLEGLRREILGAPANPKPPLGTNPFSGQVPPNAATTRMVGPTGFTSAGTSVLDGLWYEPHALAATRGLAALNLTGSMEVRVALHAPLRKSQIDLLTAVRASEIQTFGWPIGITLENREEHKPRPLKDGIRAEVSISKDEMLGRPSYDYWALSTAGDFYLLQSLFEDARGKNSIFFNTRIVRVAEALMFAGKMYTHLGAAPESQYSVRVVHRGLSGRTLSSAGGRRYIAGTRSVEDVSESETVVLLSAHRETLVADVRRLVAPMFMLFEFASFADTVFEDIVRRFENGEAT